MTIIIVNNKKYKVIDHWFWKQFAQDGWEQQTYDIYERYIDKDTVYVDIGAWLGITLIYASQFTKMRLFGVEANPLSYDMLVDNCRLNNSFSYKLSNFCITNENKLFVNFGGKDNEKNTSSASNINGNCWLVKAKKLLTYLSENGLLEQDKLFIKIDIEGAEELILEDLKYLRYFSDITIYLSIHPPFLKDKDAFCKELLSFCYDYKYVLDSSMQELSKDRLQEIIMTDEQYPEWGTKYGNFFEIVLTNKEI